MIMAPSEASLQCMLKALSEWSRKCCVYLNKLQTKDMLIRTRNGERTSLSAVAMVHNMIIFHPRNTLV